MRDEINVLYPPDTINWEMMTTGIKRSMNTYGLTIQDIRRIIKYAIEYEGYVVNPNYGIEQFLPKFIEPTEQFMQDFKENKQMANELSEEKEYLYIQPKERKIILHGKDEWEDD